MTAPALLIAAPMTGSGKTILCLGLLAAFAARGLRVGSFKVGPDFVDPAFHERVTGRPAHNLDSWAMRLATLVGTLEAAARDVDIVIGEGMMGLADGAPDGSGSTGDLAALLGIPVLFVVDCARLGGSVASLVEGFLRWREEVEIVGLVLNRVAGQEHARLLARACEERFSTRILGWFPEEAGLELPSRHLGLVQAAEQPRLPAAIERAGTLALERLDLERVVRLARPPSLSALGRSEPPCPPLGQRIAVARDLAFAFAYPSVLEGWRSAGAEISVFSPLADEPPDPAADAVFLPGGYPELHAGRLAAARRWCAGLLAAAERGAFVYGEGGGYMVLGREIVDADGRSHAMAGLLPVAANFAEPAARIGWRRIALVDDGPLGPAGTAYRGHEFHLARIVEPTDRPFALARDAAGRELGPSGCRIGPVAGSPVHVMDRELG